MRGYTIVALEQTTDSVNLSEYKFARKCAVLLGHERQGVPPELLARAHRTVEITQFGLVRSLNVHVSASLLIYEFTRQRKSMMPS